MKLSSLLIFGYRWASIFVDPLKALRAPLGFFWFLRTWWKYRKMPGAEPIRLMDTWPVVHEATSLHPFNAHYFYQGIWAFKKVQESKVSVHLDVGSKVEFIGLLSAVTRTIFVDIRPLGARVEDLIPVKGSILKLPFKDNSIFSLSCLHVAEHIGLGRYGDALDPMGTRKAVAELCRVLALGGDLYFSLPVGRNRLCFNAHRIHSAELIMDYFAGLKLMEFSVVNDCKEFRSNAELNEVKNSDNACGLFWFRKPY